VDYLGVETRTAYRSYALQVQLELIGAPSRLNTALTLQGKAHYLEFPQSVQTLWESQRYFLPHLRLKKPEWGVPRDCQLTVFFYRQRLGYLR